MQYVTTYIYIYTSPFVGHFLVIEVCHVSFVLSFVCPISSALFLFVVVFFFGSGSRAAPKNGSPVNYWVMLWSLPTVSFFFVCPLFDNCFHLFVVVVPHITVWGSCFSLCTRRSFRIPPRLLIPPRRLLSHHLSHLTPHHSTPSHSSQHTSSHHFITQTSHHTASHIQFLTQQSDHTVTATTSSHSTHHSTTHGFRVAGAVHRAFWRSFRVADAGHRAFWRSWCVRGRRWAAVGFHVAGAVYTEPSGGAGARVGAAGPRLAFVWQAQYTEPLGRVWLLCGRRAFVGKAQYTEPRGGAVGWLSHHLWHTIFHTQLCHPPSLTHHLSHHLWHTIFHSTLSHTIFHTPLCHTPLCHTPSFTHHLSHTIFVTPLCHTPSFTHHLSHHFVTHHLSHTILDTPSLTHNLSHHFVPHHLSHTTLSHTIFHTPLCHTPSFTLHLWHTIFYTPSFIHHLWHHIFDTHHLSHTVTDHLSHTIFHTPLCHTQLCHTPSFLHLLLCFSFLPRPRYNISCWLLEEVGLWGYPVLLFFYFFCKGLVCLLSLGNLKWQTHDITKQDLQTHDKTQRPNNNNNKLTNLSLARSLLLGQERNPKRPRSCMSCCEWPRHWQVWPIRRCDELVFLLMGTSPRTTGQRNTLRFAGGWLGNPRLWRYMEVYSYNHRSKCGNFYCHVWLPEGSGTMGTTSSWGVEQTLDQSWVSLSNSTYSKACHWVIGGIRMMLALQKQCPQIAMLRC